MTVYFFALLRRPNDKSDYIKTFNTFESVIEVFGYFFGIRFVFKNYVICHHLAKYVTFGNEGTFVRTAPVQEVGVLLK